MTGVRLIARMWWAHGSVTAMVAIALLLSACVGANPAALGAATRASSPRLVNPASPSTAQADPWVDFLDLAFASPTIGFDVGGRPAAMPNQVFVRRTSNGGRTWSDPVVLSVPPGSAAVGAQYGPSDRGWLYGPGLWISSDGGVTWRDTKLGGIAYAVAPIGNSVWVLRAGCRDEAGCPSRLYEVGSDGSGRRVLTGLPPSPGLEGLLRVSKSLAYAFESPITVKSAIWITRDSGATWARLTIPCPDLPNGTPELATLDGTVLWLACPTEPGAGEQLKAIYLSRDGGRTWQVRASNLFGEPAVGSISSSGYERNLVLSSPTVGFLALSRGGLLRSSDSGRSWIDTGLPNGSDGGVFGPWFADSTHGWAVTEGVGGFVDRHVWRTVDGGATWAELPAPALPAA